MRFQKILIKDCKRLPIKVIECRQQPMVELHDRFVDAVRRMISLRSSSSRSPTLIMSGSDWHGSQTQLTAKLTTSCMTFMNWFLARGQKLSVPFCKDRVSLAGP